MRPEHEQKLLKFYLMLYGACNDSGYIEVRPFTLDYELDQRNRKWINLNDKKKLVDEVKRLRHRHLFYGVATRTDEGKKENKGTKRFLKELPALFCDVDFQDFAGGRQEADEFIEDFVFPESCRVSSGHGYHLYWFLDQPFVLDDEGLRQAERVLRVLQSSLFGDSTKDVSRLLRVPYSVNVKDPAKPVLVRILSLKNRRYTFRDFTDQFWDNLVDKRGRIPGNGPETTEGHKKQAVKLKKLTVSNRIKRLIVRGKGEGDRYESRSEADMAVICSLLSAGYGEDAIREIFEKNPQGIGEKYHEKGKWKEQYLMHSIESAKEFLGK